MNKILKKTVAISAAICSLVLPVNALPGRAEDNLMFSAEEEKFQKINVYIRNNPILYKSMNSILTHQDISLIISRYNDKLYYYDPTRNIRFVRYNNNYDRLVDKKGATPKKTYVNDMICRSDISNSSVRYAYDAIMYNIEKAYDFYSNLGFDYYSFLSDNTIYVSLDEEVGSVNGTSLDGLIKFTMGTGENPNNNNNQGINPVSSTSSSKATQCYGADIDIVAHEFTHLVTQYKLGWDNLNPLETQALMEAYSDIMGELADDTLDWKIGTDIYYDNIKNNNKNICMRDLAAPENSFTDSNEQAWNKYYSHYDEFKYDLEYNDKENVAAYEASTIISHAAYLMYQNGIGIEDLKKIWYYSIDALKDMHGSTQNATFSDCRDAVIAGVKNNYKNSTALYFIQLINNAFDAVGVYSKGDVNDDGQVNGTDISIIKAYCTTKNIRLLPTEHQQKAADVNRDGDINNTNVECIMSMCRSKFNQADLDIAFNEEKLNSFINMVPDRTINGGGAYWNYTAETFINGKANAVCGCNHDNGEYYCSYVPVGAMTKANYESFDYEREEPYAQCAGFARQMQIEYFDTTKFVQIPIYGSYTPHIGDHLRSDYRGRIQHSILITGVTYNGNDNYTITYADANAEGHCEVNINCTATISGGVLYDGLRWSCLWVERPMRVGDVNSDGLINYDDYNGISDIMSGKYVSRLCRLVCDIDFNGRIDANDKSLLMEAINEKNPMKASFGFVR